MKNNCLTDVERKEVVLVFASCGMKAYRAAKKMYVSKNTVIYRLADVKKKTGLDPRNFYDLCKLVVWAGGSIDI